MRDEGDTGDTEGRVGLAWFLRETDFHLTVMSMHWSAVARIPMTLEERLGVGFRKHLGVPDKVIQAVLRHEDVSATQRSYIKTVSHVVTDAMKELEARIARAAVVQQVSATWSQVFEKLEPTSGLEPLTCRLRIIVRFQVCTRQTCWIKAVKQISARTEWSSGDVDNVGFEWEELSAHVTITSQEKPDEMT
jgi:hypothetical protein